MKSKIENHILISEDDNVIFTVPEASTPLIIPCQVRGMNKLPDTEAVFSNSHATTFSFKLLTFPWAPEKGKLPSLLKTYQWNN